MNPARRTYRPGVLELAAATALLIPFAAMRFSDEVAWGAEDFVAMGLLLFGSVLGYRMLTLSSPGKFYRIGVAIAVAGVLLLLWINLAVGIIGDEGNPANLMYLGVPAVGLVGAAIGRFRSHRMARVLFSMAGAQALVAIIAIVFRLGAPVTTPVELLVLNAVFVAVFAAAGLIFLHAAHEETPAGEGGREGI